MRRFRRVSCRNKDPYAQKLAEEMNRQQIGVTDIAERSGHSYHAVIQLFQRQRRVTASTANDLANVLGLELVFRSK